jgi:hypothetical protein
MADKSLYQQVADRDVGAHLASDATKVVFFAYIGQRLNRELAQAARKPRKRGQGGPAVTDVLTGITKCATGTDFTSVLACASQVIPIGQTLAAARAQKIACTFVEYVQMPSVTAIALKFPGEARQLGSDHVYVREPGSVFGALLKSQPLGPAPAVEDMSEGTSPTSLRAHQVSFGGAAGC